MYRYDVPAAGPVAVGTSYGRSVAMLYGATRRNAYSVTTARESKQSDVVVSEVDRARTQRCAGYRGR